LGIDSKLILEAARGTLDACCRSPAQGRSKPIETGCSQLKIHITALFLKSVRPDLPDIHL